MSSNISKRGALLDDTRQFVSLWDDTLSSAANLSLINEQNLLGLPSQSRASDVTMYALRPRFVDPGEDLVRALRILCGNPAAFSDACYYEASRADQLLGAFAEGPLAGWYDEGRLGVNADLAEQWLTELEMAESVPAWSPSLKRRVAQGLLATLRDFGRLEGATKSPNKEITGPSISDGGFAYVAYRLHQGGESSRGLLTAPVWKRWLLDGPRIDQHMHRLAAEGLVYYDRAGSSFRIDWRVESLVEVARAVA
ncbi:BrxA family protein [Candidatus Poriferisodalis sp.]|uniref:BrxA family protein n=1 Tax=Candidatus Poriferisodalis sp. TaxID=3101277 RepID=UPI003B0220F1